MIYNLRESLVKSYKRKKLRHVIDADKNSGDNSVEMDIANSDDEDTNASALVDAEKVTPVEDAAQPEIDDPTTVCSPLPLSALPQHINHEDSSTLPESPSLKDLQRQKRNLLKALAESSDTVADDSLIQEILDLEKTVESLAEEGEPEEEGELQKSEPSPSVSILLTPKLNNTTKVLRSEELTPVGVAKEIVGGTPLLKSASPYAKIPDGNNWSVGVTDVIDFENLPDATGTYNKLSGIIRRVRTVVKQINEENDAEDN